MSNPLSPQIYLADGYLLVNVAQETTCNTIGEAFASQKCCIGEVKQTSIVPGDPMHGKIGFPNQRVLFLQLHGVRLPLPGYEGMTIVAAKNILGAIVQEQEEEIVSPQLTHHRESSVE